MKKYRGYLITAALFLVIGLVFKFALLGYSFLAYGCFGITLISLLFLGLSTMKEKHPRLHKVLYKLAFLLIALFLMAIITAEIAIITDRDNNKEPEAEYAIVLGAGVNGMVPSLSLKLRLDAALEYAETYPKAMLVVTGGQGPGEEITEAKCMADWLTARGVAPERIILEEKAESTEENIGFSRDLILARDPNFSGSVCIITSGYHVFRARTMAEDMGLKALAYPADSGLPILTVNYYFREAFAVWHYLIMR